MISKKIYLAGPEVFLPHSNDTFNALKEICLKYGFEGVCPFDAGLPQIDRQINDIESIHLAFQIFNNNQKLIENCDYIVANCNSFRGPLVDDGTSWEIGYGYGKGKIIFGYLQNKVPLVENVLSKITTTSHHSGHPIDSAGYLVNENFGNSINLMLEFSIQASGGSLVEGSFEDCLRQVFTYESNKHKENYIS